MFWHARIGMIVPKSEVGKRCCRGLARCKRDLRFDALMQRIGAPACPPRLPWPVGAPPNATRRRMSSPGAGSRGQSLPGLGRGSALGGSMPFSRM
jgi:hypothetical protein